MGIIYMDNNITTSPVVADQTFDLESTNAISNKVFCEVLKDATLPKMFQCGVKKVTGKDNARRTFTVTFKKPFKTVPVVLAGRGDTSTSTGNEFAIKSISKTGFVISTFSDSYWYALTFYIHWIAIGEIEKEATS